MNRGIAVAAAAVLVAVVAAGAALLASGDGPYAFKIGDREVTQSSVDEELQALAENHVLERLVTESQGQPLSIAGGSVTAGTASGWVGLRVAQEVAGHEVERRNLPITADARDKGVLLAADSVGGPEVLVAMPKSFRDDITRRWSQVAVLQLELLIDPTPGVLEIAGAQCPSGRYVSHILVATLPEAQALEGQLDGGAAFDELAIASSIDTGSAENGGALGCLEEGAFVEPFQTTATTQALDVVSDPVQTEFGFHLIVVTDRPPPAALEQATIDEIFGRARGADVTVDPRYGRWDRRNGQVLPPRALGR